MQQSIATPGFAFTSTRASSFNLDGFCLLAPRASGKDSTEKILSESAGGSGSEIGQVLVRPGGAQASSPVWLG